MINRINERQITLIALLNELPFLTQDIIYANLYNKTIQIKKRKSKASKENNESRKRMLYREIRELMKEEIINKVSLNPSDKSMICCVLTEKGKLLFKEMPDYELKNKVIGRINKYDLTSNYKVTDPKYYKNYQFFHDNFLITLKMGLMTFNLFNKIEYSDIYLEDHLKQTKAQRPDLVMNHKGIRFAIEYETSKKNKYHLIGKNISSYASKKRPAMVPKFDAYQNSEYLCTIYLCKNKQIYDYIMGLIREKDNIHDKIYIGYFEPGKKVYMPQWHPSLKAGEYELNDKNYNTFAMFLELNNCKGNKTTIYDLYQRINGKIDLIEPEKIKLFLRIEDKKISILKKHLEIKENMYFRLKNESKKLKENDKKNNDFKAILKNVKDSSSSEYLSFLNNELVKSKELSS